MTTDSAACGGTVQVSETALASAMLRSCDASTNELGGILVGWWEGASRACVVDLLLVPDETAARSHYTRRHLSAQKLLDTYRLGQTEPRIGYIGEWHSHPAPQPPSSVDRAALGAIVRQSRKQVAMIVLAADITGRVTAHGLIGRPRWPRRTFIEQAAIERTSP